MGHPDPSTLAAQVDSRTSEVSTQIIHFAFCVVTLRQQKEEIGHSDRDGLSLRFFEQIMLCALTKTLRCQLSIQMILDIILHCNHYTCCRSIAGTRWWYRAWTGFEVPRTQTPQESPTARLEMRLIGSLLHFP